MVPNEGIDTLLAAPIDSAWVSNNIINAVESTAPAVNDFLNTPIIGAFFLFILLISLLFSSHLSKILEYTFYSVFYFRELYKIRQSKVHVGLLVLFSVFSSFILSYILLTFASDALVYEHAFLRNKIFIVPIIMISFFLLKYFILLAIDRIGLYKGQISIIIIPSLMSFSGAVIWNFIFRLISVLAGLKIAAFIEIIIPYFMGIYTLIYLIYIYKLISTTRMQKVLTILYLCTLEILPIAVITLLLIYK